MTVLKANYEESKGMHQNLFYVISVYNFFSFDIVTLRKFSQTIAIIAILQLKI